MTTVVGAVLLSHYLELVQRTLVAASAAAVVVGIERTAAGDVPVQAAAVASRSVVAAAAAVQPTNWN